MRALQLRVAGGTVTAQGALGNGGELTATTSALELPETGGTARAVAHVRGTLAAPSADVALLVSGARLQGVDVSANAIAHYQNGTLHVTDATALAAGSYATASGDVRGLAGGTPTVDVAANLHGAQIGPIARGCVCRRGIPTVRSMPTSAPPDRLARRASRPRSASRTVRSTA